MLPLVLQKHHEKPPLSGSVWRVETRVELEANLARLGELRVRLEFNSCQLELGESLVTCLYYTKEYQPFPIGFLIKCWLT
jgi:hypothetical protein